MIEFKTLSIEDLKKDYSDRQGFIFQGASICNRNNCDKVSQAIINKKICEHHVEFVVELNPQTFAFVYPDGCSFDSPSLYNECAHLSNMTGLFKIEILCKFLQEQN